MKLRRTLVMAAVALGFTVLPMVARAQEHHGTGDYDQHHEWHDASWWDQHDPKWVQEHHPDWGDFDTHHHWHDRSWWVKHHHNWVEQHHHDWL
jgi:hypothetical protein